MQTLYTSLKVNNEIELCEIDNGECKKVIEKALLENRISYFIRWPKKRLFGRKNVCIICVNDNARDDAAEIVQTVSDELGCYVRFLFKKAKNDYL